jgi:hypothetical protein
MLPTGANVVRLATEAEAGRAFAVWTLDAATATTDRSATTATTAEARRRSAFLSQGVPRIVLDYLLTTWKVSTARLTGAAFCSMPPTRIELVHAV